MCRDEMRITIAASGGDIDDVRGLFREYADSLGFDLCFQGFENELAGLPGEYASPEGILLLAKIGEKAAGCVGLRPLQNSTWQEANSKYCEMKRLYVRPEFRGRALGRRLVERIIAAAESPERGYHRMRLDTIGSQMALAVALYRKFGFYEISPYRHNPVSGVLYMERKLRAESRNPGVTCK